MSNIFKGSPPAGEAASSRSTSPGRRAPRFRSDSEFERAAAPIVAEAAPPPPDPLDTLPPVPALARTVASALVISDQPPLAGGIRSLLEELGYRVEVSLSPAFDELVVVEDVARPSWTPEMLVIPYRVPGMWWRISSFDRTGFLGLPGDPRHLVHPAGTGL